MAEQIRVDSEGNPQVDFVWGGMAPQPDAERQIDLDPVLGDHPIYKEGYSGFPGFKTEEVDNAPGIADEVADVVAPGSERAVTEAGAVKVDGKGVTKSSAQVQKMAEAKLEAQKQSIAEQAGVGLLADPETDITAPDRSEDKKLEASEDPTPLDENKLSAEQEKAKKAAEKAANSPVAKTVVMTPAEAIEARMADGRTPLEVDVSEPIAPVTEQKVTGQDKVKENHNPDSEPGEVVLQEEAKGEAPVDQHPERVSNTPAAKTMPKATVETQKAEVSTEADAKAPTKRVPAEKAKQIAVEGAGDPKVVDPDTQVKDPAKNPATPPKGE